MRRFSSYGPINTKFNYYAPRKELIDKGYTQLVGENPDEGGHYITVWAPRQCGKSWIMQEIVESIKQTGRFDAAIISMERAKELKKEGEILEILVEKLQNAFTKPLPQIKKITDIPRLFTTTYFQKPVILVMDEFDALEEKFINRFASILRDMFLSRTNERDKASDEKTCLLHGVSLIGVRSVLGIENVKGSPFNVQRSLHIPDLTFDEVKEMFNWYEKESGQPIEPAVIEKLYYETNGQPGLTCWFGELLTEGFDDYKPVKNRPVTMRDFEIVYAAATYALPNNNILNIISKANNDPNKSFILKMFQTQEKLEFRFDDKTTNSLYMNGVVEKEVVDQTRYYIKFSCPFVQKRLFNYFSYELFNQMGTLSEPFVNLDDVITNTELNIVNLLKLYRKYLVKNKNWLFKTAPRRSDLKLYEAVYHFNLFSYLNEFLRDKGGSVVPEFPTGNGRIDLIIDYKGKRYGIELKSYKDQAVYRIALKQAALYGKRLGLEEIVLAVFVESIDEAGRSKYEVDYLDDEMGVIVKPVFIATED